MAAPTFDLSYYTLNDLLFLQDCSEDPGDSTDTPRVAPKQVYLVLVLLLQQAGQSSPLSLVPDHLSTDNH